MQKKDLKDAIKHLERKECEESSDSSGSISITSSQDEREIDQSRDQTVVKSTPVFSDLQAAVTNTEKCMQVQTKKETEPSKKVQSKS